MGNKAETFFDGKIALGFSLIVILIAGYKQVHSAEKPKLSEIFKTELIQYLKDAGKLSTQSGEGINFKTLRSQLTEAKATFDLLNSTWPADFLLESKEEFKKSHEGYDLALKIWSLKINESDYPTEPDINSWSTFQAYAGDALIVKTYEDSFIVADYRGKKYLPFDENIRVLLTIASLHFEKGREFVLKGLE